jgi:hypothetical protein
MIPKELKCHQAKIAMDQLGPDPAAWPKYRQQLKRWAVIHPDQDKRWRMPPKLVISVAAKNAGINLGNRRFGPDEAVPWLRSCGFEILDLDNP